MRKEKNLRDKISKPSAYMTDRRSDNFKQAIDDVELICYDTKIYMPQNQRRCVIDWYHLCINHPGRN